MNKEPLQTMIEISNIQIIGKSFIVNSKMQKRKGCYRNLRVQFIFYSFLNDTYIL